MTESEAILALNAVPNMDAVLVRRLLKHFGSALKVWGVKPSELSACAILKPELLGNLLNFSTDKFLTREYNLMQRNGICVVTAIDDNFPCSFNDYENAPVVLYVKGDSALLHQEAVALVGSRAASFYGRQSARTFARAFVQEGLTVVSGLARGIDTAAHQGALEAGGKTVAVIACGFNYMYPKENQSLMLDISRSGAVVCEYAFDMPPLRHNFPWRNRVISALSSTTVVIEAGLRSGALITADYAIAQNKDVFVLPANIDTQTAQGSNQLIRDGAMVALSPEDVIRNLRPGFFSGPQEKQKPVLVLSDEQLSIYPYITSEPVHVDELVRQSGLNISSLMNITLSLELKNLIRQLPGQYYVRNTE